MKKVKLAISVGDLNGIGIELALLSHEKITAFCEPLYCINQKLLEQASRRLDLKIPKDFKTYETKGDFKIKPAKVSKKSGKFSFNSFYDAITLANNKEVDGIVTLPINKESWSKAGITYKGHTEVLRTYFGEDAIMMLGCQELFVGLYTEHIPLKKVAKKIKEQPLTQFLLNFYENVKSKKILVLGLNPHAGDNGVLGDEEIHITKAIQNANQILGEKVFNGPAVPDIAFTPFARKNYQYMVAMYHDQGLAPLKALYFEESINVSLNLPIIRTSVDHGTAFDIAYKPVAKSQKSYINAVKEAVHLANKR